LAVDGSKPCSILNIRERGFVRKEVRKMGWFIAGFLSTTAILEG